MNNNAAHDQLKADIRLDLGARQDCRIFSNPTGVARYQGGFAVPYGLVEGASDLIAIVRRPGFKLPTGAYVPVGVWLAIEVKTGRGVLTKKQAAFLDMIRDFGGVSGVARSVDDARRLYDEARSGIPIDKG